MKDFIDNIILAAFVAALIGSLFILADIWQNKRRPLP